MNTPLNAIGLFGTCGKSTWRDAFMARYTAEDVPFYNPQVAPGTWTPAMASLEAEHLANDKVVLFAITDETFSFGSLAETGYSALNAIQNGTYLLVYISPTVAHQEPVHFPTVTKDCVNTRALVQAHLAKLNSSNVIVCNSLDDLLAQSLVIWNRTKALDL